MVTTPSIDDVSLDSPPGWEDLSGQVRIRHVQIGRDRRAVAEASLFRGNIEARGRRGVGVWHLDGPDRGKLVRWMPAEAASLLPSESALLVLEYGLRVVRYSWPGLTEVDEAPVHQYAEDIVVSASERRFLTWLNDGQGANGYEIYALDGSLRELEVGEDMSIDRMFSTPVFSPSDRLVACAHGVTVDIGAWWSPDDEDAWPDDVEDEFAVPSPGGLTTFGRLAIHDLEEDALSRHELRFDLSPGWVPADYEDGRWEFGVVRPEFLSDDHVRLTLADGVAVDLDLPLPDEVLLPTPARTLPPDPEDRWSWR